MSDAPSPTHQPIKVLHVSAGNVIGGVESVLLALADASKSVPSLQQEFALTFDGPFAESLRATGTSVYLLPNSKLRNLLSVIQSRHEFSRLIGEQQYDAVLSHSPWCQVIYGPVIKKIKRPLVFWMHNNFDGHWLQRLAARHSPALTICNSRFTQSTLSRIYPQSPSQIIHGPVRPSKVFGFDRSAVRKQLAMDDQTVVILMASRMDRWKGHLNLIQAACRIRTKTEWAIWIAGAPQTSSENSYFASVQSETRRAGLTDRVRFLGHRNDVASLMRAADILCQPNAEPEPFGIVFVEALQASVPVVTYRMGGVQEILDEKCGLLVVPHDIDGLAGALVRLIEDASLRQFMGSNGPVRALELCDPVRQTRRLYEALAAVCTRD